MRDRVAEHRKRYSPLREAIFFVALLVGLWVVGLVAFGLALGIAEMADYPEGPMILVNWISLALARLLGFPVVHLMEFPGVFDWAYTRFGSFMYHVVYGLSAMLWASLLMSVRHYRRRRGRTSAAPATSGA
jgi:hypothetical protein